MNLTSLAHRRSITADPAAHTALVEACWYWADRAEDLADDPAEIPELVADHLADVASFLRDITTDDDLAEGDDDDPALVSAKSIAEATPVAQWDAIADALDDLAEEIGR